MADKQITVLLIDDHPVVLSGYRKLLENTAGIRMVADANDGETGCMLYELHHPDVAIIDLNMPGIDGIETIRRIKTKNPAAKILVFSMHCNKILVQRALEMGAIGFLTKQSDVSQLTEAISQINQGQLYIDPILTKKILSDDLTNNNHGDPLTVLSKREFQLFKLFAEGNSCAQVAENISISPKTVGVHHANIMKKLRLQNTTQLVRMAIKYSVIQV